MKGLLVPLVATLISIGSDARAQNKLLCPFSSAARSALGWRHDMLPGKVVGREFDGSTAEPLPETSVRLDLASDTAGLDSSVYGDNRGVRTIYRHQGLGRHRTRSDSAGGFEIAGVVSGQYRITVGSAGRVAQDTLTVGGSGIRIFAALARWDGDIVCVVPGPPNLE